MLVAGYCGLRLGELTPLGWSDVDLQGRTLRVVRGQLPYFFFSLPSGRCLVGDCLASDDESWLAIVNRAARECPETIADLRK